MYQHCVAFPTLDMLREGYEINPVADAIGPPAHDNAMQRMLHARAQPINAISLVAELQHDWGHTGVDNLRSILRWYFPQLHDIRANA